MTAIEILRGRAAGLREMAKSVPTAEMADRLVAEAVKLEEEAHYLAENPDNPLNLIFDQIGDKYD